MFLNTDLYHRDSITCRFDGIFNRMGSDGQYIISTAHFTLGHFMQRFSKLRKECMQKERLYYLRYYLLNLKKLSFDNKKSLDFISAIC